MPCSRSKELREIPKSVDRHLKRYFLSKFKEMGITPVPLEKWKKKLNDKLSPTE